MVPRLWDGTIEAHRHGVREAILDTTWAMASQRGVRAVTMSHVAAEAGIGRATLYKYFSDVEAILLAWHQRHVAGHLEHLGELADGSGPALDRLEAVLAAYAHICQRIGRHAPDLVALLHHHPEVAGAQEQLRAVVENVVVEAATAGDLRSDVAPHELTVFCLRAMTAAADLPDAGSPGRVAALAVSALFSD